MNTEIIISNLTNPVLLFFLLGVLATLVKSDLQIPEATSKFISLYLLFSIGFRGGQELAHSGFTSEITVILLAAIVLACLVPVLVFFVVKKKFSVSDAGAVAAAYGSVSAVTFVAATGFLEARQEHYGGYMVAAMALMEAPAIIIGVLLMRRYAPRQANAGMPISKVVHEGFTNGSVLMIMGSLVIGLISDEKQAKGIEPFTSDIFKGFLAVFLLEMGMVAARRFGSFRRYGWFATLVALVLPALLGCLVAWASGWLPLQEGNRLLLAVLSASASYIAVPAAMRHAAPDADPGLYIPMALGVTFPFNITVGIPVFWSIVSG